MQYYDMHSHILPAFDDGARTIDDSLKLIDSLRRQGVTNICLTPHYYTNERSLEDFLEKREEAFENFKPHIPDDIRIVLGAEVYVTEYLFNNDRLPGITYGKSKYILTEYPYNSNFGEKTMQMFYALIQNYGMIPVMPHVERYPNLIGDPDLIEEMQDIGVVIQTNAGSYTDKASFFKKRKMFKLMEAGLIDILGTDTHSFKHNNPDNYSEAIRNIRSKCGSDKVSELMDNAAEIFEAALGE